MKTKFATLICSAPVFRRYYNATARHAFLLPEKLQNLVSLVFHVPSEQPDGPTAKKFLTSEGIIRKQGEQHRTVCAYISSCNDELQRNPSDGNELNKPNVHRALELCVLTIPSFVRVELVFLLRVFIVIFVVVNCVCPRRRRHGGELIPRGGLRLGEAHQPDAHASCRTSD